MLSEENKEILNKLVDPDQQAKSKYTWDEDFQREILGMLLTNKVFVCQTKGLIEPNYFLTKYINRFPDNLLIISKNTQRFLVKFI